MRRIINSDKNNPFYGRTHSPETIKKLKKTFTKERREKLSNAIKGEKNPNYKGKLFKKAIYMLNPQTNEILKKFDSRKEAGLYCKEAGITNAKNPDCNIGDALSGRQKTAYGYKWEYVKKDVTTNETT